MCDAASGPCGSLADACGADPGCVGDYDCLLTCAGERGGDCEAQCLDEADACAVARRLFACEEGACGAVVRAGPRR